MEQGGDASRFTLRFHGPDGHIKRDGLADALPMDTRGRGPARQGLSSQYQTTPGHCEQTVPQFHVFTTAGTFSGSSKGMGLGPKETGLGKQAAQMWEGQEKLPETLAALGGPTRPGAPSPGGSLSCSSRQRPEAPSPPAHCVALSKSHLLGRRPLTSGLPSL